MKKFLLYSICGILFFSIVSIAFLAVLYSETDGRTLESRQYVINKVYKDTKIQSEHFLGKSNSYVLDIFYSDRHLGMAFFSKNALSRWELSKVKMVAPNGIILFDVCIENQNYYIGTINNDSKKVMITFEYEEQNTYNIIEDISKSGFFIVNKPNEKHRVLLDFN